MSIITDLQAQPGVVAAGEYAFRGDPFTAYRGELTEEQARMCTIMCRATTMGVVMEGRMAEVAAAGSRFALRGWAMRGPQYTLCVVANVFCMMRNEPGTLDAVIARLNEHLANVD